MTLQIVILAMIAGFLGLRLYSVLGRKAEHEDEPLQARFEEKSVPSAVSPLSPASPGLIAATSPVVKDAQSLNPEIEHNLRAIAAADRKFDLAAFMQGAAGAYKMVLEAFWRGDKNELAQLCDRDVYEGFSNAIDARNNAGETLSNRLIRIEEAVIHSAEFSAPVARITVLFVSDIAALTRNAEGQVVAGSLNDAIVSRDLWTFRRDLTANGPDWLLDDTDEA